MGFPYRHSSIDYDRHTTNRVHRTEVRCIQTSKLATYSNMSITNAEFGNEPHHLLDIEGALPTIDCEHACVDLLLAIAPSFDVTTIPSPNWVLDGPNNCVPGLSPLLPNQKTSAGVFGTALWCQDRP
jgi:hypothetical protein